MKVKHFMTEKVFTVTSDIKITDALDIMEENHFHRLPVVEKNRFLGLITEEIIAENAPSKVSSLSIYEMNYLFDKVLVKELMLKDVETTTPDELIEEAALRMSEKDITVLPVLNDKKEVVGIITHKDIFKALIELTGYQDEGTRIVIETPVDRVGIMAEFSKALADQNINVSHIFVNRPDDVVEVTIQATGENSASSKEIIEALGYNVYEI